MVMAVVPAGLAVMGHAHAHVPGARGTAGVRGGEGHVVDPARARPAAFGPEQHRGPLHDGIRARVTVAQAVHRLVLSHGRDRDRDVVVVGVGYAHDPDGHELVVGRP